MADTNTMEAEGSVRVEPRHPEWIKGRMPGAGAFDGTGAALRTHGVMTVCEEARCPNRGECFARRTATFLILGGVCTRRCGFCAVTKGSPTEVDPLEPGRLAAASRELGLRHVVITSVTRDDLPDGGAAHFAACARAVKIRNGSGIPSVEFLVPDFGGSSESLWEVLDSPVDVFNHNLETVPRLYRKVRPQADYHRSLHLLWRAGRWRPEAPTKSGIMLGLGETEPEIRATLCDLRDAGVRMVTIGQYLQPSRACLPLVRHVTPDEFMGWKAEAMAIGFRHVESGPLVRSSFHAAEQLAGAASCPHP